MALTMIVRVCMLVIIPMGLVVAMMMCVVMFVIMTALMVVLMTVLVPMFSGVRILFPCHCFAIPSKIFH
jgi:hypothetical protein